MKYLKLKNLVCDCPNGFYGSKCQHKKFCGYCLHTSCQEDGNCSPCPNGLSGNQCKDKVCDANMHASMCGGQGIYI